MALSTPCINGHVVADTRAVLTLAGVSNNAGVLPLDAVHEILLRLPGKELCRLRTVCRLWRSLLSDDQAFAAAHAARHAEPLILAGYATHTNNGILYDILDLSGRVVKRVHAAEHATAGETDNEWVISTGLDLICVGKRRTSVNCRLLSPATGVVRVLPQGLAEEHAAYEQEMGLIGHHRVMVALGQVASTGQRKVLRVLHLFPNAARQLYEIITLDGGNNHARWRRTIDPAFSVGLGTWASAVIGGIVYLFSSEFVQGQDVMPDRIASFDLETEEWRPTIRGPLSSSQVDDVAGHPNNHMDWGEFSLAVLNDCLVVTHRTFPSSMDLWFLMDVGKGFWMKKHSIQLKISYQHAEHTVRPLLVLNDGRVVLIHIGNRGSLKIYNPSTSTCTDVAEIGPCVAAVGLYTGSLLSLANGAI